MDPMSIDVTHSPEVEKAKKQGQPIVALESTIITHGMPYPQNVEMAQAVEALIREEGATPATIAILKGRLHIGMTGDEIEELAHAKDVMKVSRADIGFALSQGATGATTVAATMIAATHAGIGVFATGGIGGVHRGADQSFDISADLEELAQTPVITVCAGAKAILDIPKTLEVLETKGVPVIGYGVDAFPAFWSRESGLTSPLRLDTPEQVARMVQTRRELGLSGGTLVANPIPKEAEIPREVMEGYIATALERAKAEGISGKAVTPYLLQRIFDLSAGRSLIANIALVKNNARLAAHIALAF